MKHPKKLISTQCNSESGISRSFRSRFKSYVSYLTLSYKAILSFLLISSLFFPLIANASILSFFGFTDAKANDDTLHNSQNAPLLEATTLAQNTSSDAPSDGLMLQGATGPLGSQADNTDDVNDQISLYVVKQGDTLPVVAKLFAVSVNTIRWANDLPKNATVKEGDTLLILPVTGVSYTVKKGDTLKSIARKFKADVDDVGRFNGLEQDSDMTVGDTLIIPDGEMSDGGTISGQTGGGLPQYAYGKTRLMKQWTTDLGSYYIRPIHGGYRSQGLHGYNGVDLAASIGTPVLAAADGVVIAAKSSGWNTGYGNYVVIRHPNGTQTLYAHLLSVNVTAGQNVSQGNQIGQLGKSGRATGPHVHFEVRGAKNPLGDNPSYGL